ncbi:lysozyme inhibitor LprI family protein [Pacificoceanicola onchidii]|uniref:lysozyme inhibitor LprI family protein n=1 Tax=Pacificoceanicola onchidii TaxID=2562685 RepID=UPI0010A2F207|nr:lysozyme inhibitor LprI family protein [Pacificoceanicola onchidii]
MKRLLLIAAMSCAAPALGFAQDLSFSMATTEECFASEGTFDECVGASALACMEGDDAGFTTVGMGFCYEQERAAWDAELNRVYKDVMALSKQMDAENGAYAPSQAEALRAMQRAWIPFRDAKCAYERSQWGGGTGGGPATLSCLMYETARQVRDLRAALLAR